MYFWVRPPLPPLLLQVDWRETGVGNETPDEIAEELVAALEEWGKRRITNVNPHAAFPACGHGERSRLQLHFE